MIKSRGWLCWVIVAVCCGILLQACAPKASEGEGSSAPAGQKAEPTQENVVAGKSEGGLWDNIPVMDGTILEESTECVGQWADCQMCEHRLYVSQGDIEALCVFYKETMPKQGWTKLVYQAYPEGACMGTWMDGTTRVFVTGGIRSSDDVAFVGITVGKERAQPGGLIPI